MNLHCWKLRSRMRERLLSVDSMLRRSCRLNLLHLRHMLLHGWKLLHLLHVSIRRRVRCISHVVRRPDHSVRRGEVSSKVAGNALLGTTLAWFLLFTLQVKASACFTGLRYPTVLDDGRPGLRIILGVAQGMSLQQICSRESFGADLTLIWLLLGVHPHVA